MDLDLPRVRPKHSHRLYTPDRAGYLTQPCITTVSLPAVRYN